MMKKRTIHMMDIHVGKRLKLRRNMLGLSQEALGKHIGITFQQIQKYERGSNRIYASRLYDLSVILECRTGWFFEEFDGEVRGLMSYLDDDKLMRHIQQLSSLNDGLDDAGIEFVRQLAIRSA